MNNHHDEPNVLYEMRLDTARKQKRGVHFIVASVFIWIMIGIIYHSELPIEVKNLYTFCCSSLLLPLAFLFSKLLKIEFKRKNDSFPV